MPYLGREIQRKSSFNGPTRLEKPHKTNLYQDLAVKCVASRNNAIRSHEQPNLHNIEGGKQRATGVIGGLMREAGRGDDQALIFR